VKPQAPLGVGLTVACAKNLQRLFMASENVNYVSTNISGLRGMVKMDICHMGAGDKRFDAIICSHVLEHVPDDRKAMSELYRVLKPNGWAILLVPIATKLQRTHEDPDIKTPEERERVFGQADHVRLYGQDYNERLQSAGFRVRVFDAKQSFGQELVRRHALPQRGGDIYLCSR
jgi:ubiquinone/menaquinone biosynthesis C-methylase UbiE